MNNKKLIGYASKFTKQFTEIITTGEKEEEMTLGAFQALANVMVIMAIRHVGNKDAPDIIASAISSAFKMVNQVRTEMGLNKPKGE